MVSSGRNHSPKTGVNLTRKLKFLQLFIEIEILKRQSQLSGL